MRIFISFLSASSILFLANCGSTSSVGTQTSAGLPPSSFTDTCSTATFGEVNVQAEEVCKLSNAERSKSNVSELKLDPTLTAVAQAHAVDMVSRKFFSHTNPDGKDAFERLRDAGVAYTYAAENIAQGQTSPASALSTWMNSSGHRANILNGKYKRIGVGVHQNHWVQVFSD